MGNGIRRGWIVGALAVLLAALAVSAPAASASDTFFLKNQTQSTKLIGESLWGEGNTMPAECRTGPFPGPTLAAFTFNPGDSGSITLTRDPFSDCLPGINPLINNSLEGPGIDTGAWVWIPVDPVVGWAHLTCNVVEQTGTTVTQASVDGLTCTFTDAGNAAAGSFVSSAAPIRSGKAVTYVQHVPGSTGGEPDERARYSVTLRSRKGKVLGREKATLEAGEPGKLSVPITKAVRRKVRKKDFARVKAVIKRADGEQGKGDRATLIVLKDSKSIPF